MAAVVPVDLAEEFRRIVPVPPPAVKQVLSLYRISGPTHGLATIHTEASLVLFELASVLSGSVRCAPGSVETCCYESTDVLADARKNN